MKKGDQLVGFQVTQLVAASVLHKGEFRIDALDY